MNSNSAPSPRPNNDGMSIARILRDGNPPFTGTADQAFYLRGDWPASWVAGQPGASLFRCRFQVADGGPQALHVSADQRYELFLDGQRIACGPGVGDLDHWPYDSYAGTLAPGEHLLVARVWHFTLPRHAQCSVRPAFLCAAEDALHAALSTGTAPWEMRPDPAWRELPNGACWGVGAKTGLLVDAAHLAGPVGGGEGWQPCVSIRTASSRQFQRGRRWLLTPSTLPAQHESVIRAGSVRLGDERIAALLAGQQLVLAPGERVQALIDLGHYRCAFSELDASGVGEVNLAWAEALFTGTRGDGKAHRAAVDGLRFDGIADHFTFTGPRGTVRPWWWQAGRFVEITATAGAQPLLLHSLAWRETGYPLVGEGAFASSDARLDACVPLLERTLARCAHETFMDCPYYEQLQYIGDTRLQCLVLRAMTRDHRLSDLALSAFAWSRDDEGLLSSRWPTWEWQAIPPFSLLWIGMLHDAWLHDDAQHVRAHLGTMRTIRDRFAAFVRPDGLLGRLPGWHFIDWVPAWGGGGEAPGQLQGVSAVATWLFAYALRLKAEIEDWADEPHLAARDRALAAELAAGCEACWDEARGCYRDAPQADSASEHAQILALLSGQLAPPRVARLLDTLERDQALIRTTVYFSHYLFEVAARFQRPALLFARLEYWRALVDQGFTTVPERPEPSRSDCHAWGAHPRYHLVASVLGIRPAAPGYAAVRITPMPGPLQRVSGTWPHPLGDITVSLADGHGQVSVPPGLPATVVLDGREHRVTGSWSW